MIIRFYQFFVISVLISKNRENNFNKETFQKKIEEIDARVAKNGGEAALCEPAQAAAYACAAL